MKTHPTKFLLFAAVLAFANHVNAELIQIQFGGATGVPANWNVVPGEFTSPPLTLLNSSGLDSGLKLDSVIDVQGVNGSGSSSPSGDALLWFPDASITGNSIYGNDTAFPEITLNFSGMDQNTSYTFTIFAARSGVGDVREAKYTFTGSSTESVTLDAANNNSEVVTTSALSPNGSDGMTLVVSNSDADPTGYYYLGGIVIEAEAIPEPSSLILLGIGGVAGVVARRFRRC